MTIPHKYILNFFMLLLMSVPSRAWAQVGAPEALSLSDARAELIAANPSVAAAQARVAEAEAQLDVARSNLRPTVNATALYQLNDTDVNLTIPNPYAPLEPWLRAAQVAGAPDPTPLVEAGDTVSTIRYQHEIRGEVSITQPIIVPEAWAGVRVARAGVVLRESAVGESAFVLDQTLLDLYFAAVQAERQREVLEQYVSLANNRLNRARAAADAGAGPRFEATRAEVTYLGALRSEQQAALARDRIIRAMGALLDRETDFSVVTPPELEVSGGVDDWWSRALVERPDLRRAHAQEDFAESSADVPRDAWYPTLAAVGNGFAQRETDLSGPMFRWNIQVVASWDLYRGGERSARARAADAAIEASMSETRALELRIRSELEQASLRRQEAELVATQARAEADLALENYERTQIAVDAGAASILDQEAAEQQWLAAELSAVNAEVSLLAENYRIDLLAGR